MPIFEKQGRRIAFIHIPKAAGSSIEKYFTQLGWTMTFYSQFNDPNIPADQHLTYTALRDRVPDLDSIPSFTVVRNPYKRIVSEWRWHRTVVRTTMISFSDFVRRVFTSLKTSKTYWDNHWRPQSDFLNENIDCIVQLENIDAELGVFLEKQGFDPNIKLPRTNQTKHRFRRSLTADTTPETIARIQQIYAIDFEQLNYSVDEVKI